MIIFFQRFDKILDFLRHFRIFSIFKTIYKSKVLKGSKIYLNEQFGQRVKNDRI